MDDIATHSNGCDAIVNSKAAKVPIVGNPMLPMLCEKTVIIHKDKCGFGFRIKGSSPVFVEHVHEDGAAWSAGVRRFDKISKVNGQLVTDLDHKEVVLMIRDCPVYVTLTLLGSIEDSGDDFREESRGTMITDFKSRFDKWHKFLSVDNNDFEIEQYLNMSSSTFVELEPSAISTSLQSKPLFIEETQSKSSSSTRRSETIPGSYKQDLEYGDLKTATIPVNGHIFDLVRGLFDIPCLGCKLPLLESAHYACSLCGGTAHRSCLKKISESHYCNNQEGKPSTYSVKNRQNRDHNNDDENTFAKRDRVLQSSSSSSLPANGSKTLEDNEKASLPERPSSRRREIIRELISTELAHTHRLRHLNNLFYKPMKAESLVSQEQLRMVFSCHKTLLRIHKKIHDILKSHQFNRFNEPLIGPALIQIFEGDIGKKLEKAACTFCSCQSMNTDLLNKLSRRDTKVGDFLAQAANHQLIGRLGLKDLLASCFQRLTKYPLLLENLLKATPTAMIDGANFGDEHEYIRRSLHLSRQILIRVDEAVKMATSQTKLKEIWKKTDKHSSVPTIDISKQQLVHEGPLTLRMSKRSHDVYVLLLTEFICILIRDHQDKYKLKPFPPDAKSNNFYSPVFVIDEHLSTRESATDENGFYLLCKKKDDSRMYELGALSPSDRCKWRDKIQWTIENQMHKLARNNRRQSNESNSTKSGSDNSSRPDLDETNSQASQHLSKDKSLAGQSIIEVDNEIGSDQNGLANVSEGNPIHPTKMEGTISFVGEEDVLIMPSKIEECEIVLRESVRVVSVQQKLNMIDRNLKNLLEQKLALIAATSTIFKDNMSSVYSNCFNGIVDYSKYTLNPIQMSPLLNKQPGTKWLDLAVGAMNVSSLIISENECQQSNPRLTDLRDAVLTLRTQIDSFLKSTYDHQAKLRNTKGNNNGTE